MVCSIETIVHPVVSLGTRGVDLAFGLGPRMVLASLVCTFLKASFSFLTVEP